MYRLHNVGIEGKIDWLVKHGRLDGKQIVIVLWNDLGMKIKQYLNLKWGLQETAIIDDDVAAYNHTVKTMADIPCLEKEHEDLVYIMAAESETDIHNVLLQLWEHNVVDEKMFILKGQPLRAQDALLKCCEDTSIRTVLDVGYGYGLQSNIFLAYGKEVTGIDFGSAKKPFKTIQGDFDTYIFEDCYDLVWSSHSLEHQQNIRSFIQKLFSVCNKNGKVAITVPYEQNKNLVVGGHVTVWNVGLLMYNIILSGYNCVHAAGKTYAGNASVIVPNEPIHSSEDYRLLNVKEFFPKELDVGDNGWGNVYFDGNIKSINWE